MFLTAYPGQHKEYYNHRFSHFLWSFISSGVAELAGASLLLKNDLATPSVFAVSRIVLFWFYSPMMSSYTCIKISLDFIWKLQRTATKCSSVQAREDAFLVCPWHYAMHYRPQLWRPNTPRVLFTFLSYHWKVICSRLISFLNMLCVTENTTIWFNTACLQKWGESTINVI